MKLGSLLTVVICLAQVGFGQTNNGIRPLAPGQLVERDILGGQDQAYKITLAAGQFIRVEATPRGVNLTLILFAPDGRQLIAINFTRFAGPETLYWEAAVGGDYRLVVRGGGLPAITGAYQARLEVKDTAGEQDRRRLSTERALVEAFQPNAQGVAAQQKIIELAQQAVVLCHDSGDQVGEAFALFLIGSAWHSQNRFEKAMEYYEPALAIVRKLKLRGDEGDLLKYLGTAYSSMNQYEKASELLVESLAVREDIKDRAGALETLRSLNRVYSSMNLEEKAIERGMQGLSIARELKDKNNEGAFLQIISGSYTQLGREGEAIKYGEEALSIARETRNREVESNSLNRLGSSAYYLGAFEKARIYFEQALAIARELKDPTTTSGYLLNLGNVYNAIGRLEKSVECFGQTLAIARETKNRRVEALALTCIGNAFFSLRDNDKALSYLEQSLVIYREFKDRGNEGLTLQSMGRIHISIDRQDKAIELLNQALTINREIKRRRNEAICLNYLGDAYFSLKQYDEAIKSLDQALAISREVKDRANEAAYLENLGKAWQGLARYDRAAEYYNQSLSIRRELKSQRGEAIVLYTFAKFELKRGDLGAARSRIEESLKIVESMRADIYNQELRASFFATEQINYRFYIDLLMRLNQETPGKGLDALAVEISERARARSLLELLTESSGDIRLGVDAALLERERALARQVNLKAQELTQEKAPNRIAALNQEISALENDRQQAQGAIRRASPRYAALTQPQPLKFKEIQAQLDADTLLLEYSLGDERSFLWAITRDSLNSYELPKQEQVEQGARRVYDLLVARSRPPKNESPSQKRDRLAQADASLTKAAGDLSQMLLSPVAEELGKKRLVIVADGALQYLPFAMLPTPETGRRGDGAIRRQGDKEKGRQGDKEIREISNQQSAIRNPLIADHEIVNLPSASTIAVQRLELAGRPEPSRTLAVIADPVFSMDDERLKLLALNGSTRKEKEQSKSSATASVAARVDDGSDVAGGLETPAAGADTTRIIEHLSENSTAGPAGKLIIPRLPFTRQEADQIVAVAEMGNSAKSANSMKTPGAEILKAIDFKASRDTVFSSELSKYRYLHFATHGLLNSEQPGLSALVLSLVDEEGKPKDGFLRAHEIYNLNLTADLVVLSACQTGLGKEIKGEGMVGLTRGFMYAGAARVIVSLWNVNDKATSDLMVKFYQKMLKEGQRPAAALRAAQIELWRQGQWRSPYYWAPFVLQGEWR